ncbi:hypothetical protein Ssi03_76880 [Sphaerisporangium siamense]|uniref:Uncharacterized protein n=1 Tax=Sphaerisporangium siamense TaxID=795645 RepID=A0A7W7DGP8_9ACTN|nr:hypothetical protein [Sphaerisporangium siamense]MBB4706174.1 hypothetical protein [Sphaerisporangium siamense]GII89698.1 hypothetical protein Ssi03_76880 [Sphaerisporangium siamense]
MARATTITAPAAPAAEAAAVAVRHRPQIGRGIDAYGRRSYRFTCPCGAAGAEQAARRMAQWDHDRHIAELPEVPAARRCRDPRRHGCLAWEPCRTCEDQLPLFEVAELVDGLVEATGAGS